MRCIACALLSALLLGACSPGDPAESPARQSAASRAEEKAAVDRPAGQGRRSPHGERTDDGAEEAAGEGEDDARYEASQPTGASGGDGPRSERPHVRGGSSRGTAGSVRSGPKTGRYVYAQSGWEEFCAGTCSRNDLPPSAAIDTTVSTVGDRLKIVSESESSERRSMRSTSFLSENALAVARVELRYGGFSNTYDPSPPVRSLVLPLRVGDRWTSAWSAHTSGRYTAEVVGTDRLVIGGRTIEAYKLDTVTRFTGEFRGTLASIVWIDPATATTVRTDGKARITTDYGRFNSNFDTMLIDGPGYE